MRPVRVVPPDPRWAERFRQEAPVVEAALSPGVVAVHHIGSTAIPGIYAKPIVDMLVEVADIQAVDRRAPAMEAQGYQALGEYGIPGRRYFRKDGPGGVRLFHVHVFQVGSPGAMRHLAFRDFLRAHPAWAQRYSDLKRRLAAAHPEDMEAYMDGKDPFIQEVESLALAWWPAFQTPSKGATMSEDQPTLRLSLLPEPLAICRLPPSALIPAWAMIGSFFTLTRTDEELSIVCPAARVPEEVTCESGWRALKVAGPLDFALTGVLASLAGPLAQAGISLFAVSTYDTDYLLLKEERLAQAISALRAAGHQLEEG